MDINSLPLLIAYSILDEKLVKVDDVPSGKRCNCICPSCKQPVAAKKGEIRKYHFAHIGEYGKGGCHECKGYKMTQLHLLAQEVIEEERKLMIPRYADDFFVASESKQVCFIDVQKEKYDINAKIRPDIIAVDENGLKYRIEICNSHAVDRNKINKIKDNDYICLEIYIDKIEFSSLNITRDELKNVIKDFLINSSNHRIWINHPFYKKLIEEKRIEYQKKVEEERRKQEAEKEKRRKQEEEERKEQQRKDRQIEEYYKKTKNKNDQAGTSDKLIAGRRKLLKDLNEGQQRAVEYNDGASLVIAGAGSGKTRVLTYKIAYLLTQGMRPWEILALTFTNKAAREMKERIGKLVGTELSQQLHMGTFHSVFSRILRVEAAQLGYDSNFTIYDETDSRSLLKSIIKTMNLDDKTYKPSTVHNRISMAKNHLITADAYAQDRSFLMRDQEARIPAVSQIYLAYQARLQQANAMDFDDLLLNTYLLFRQHEDIRLKYAQRFHYVLVDEYQDTNYAQQAIVLQLTKEHQHVCVVGDDAQSIYAFRGANIDNILDFQQQFNDTKLFKLEQNYRSTQRIVKAANSLIRHNQRQIEKDVFSENDEGEKLIYKPAYSDREEAMIVCNDIKRIHRQDHCEYSDFAILYRTNAQSRTFEEEMRKQAIPYRIYGGLSFYQRKEIKDIIAYFRLVANPNDEEAFRRILNYPARGIGNTTLQKIMDCSARAGVSLWTVICDPAAYGLDVNKGTMTKIDAFRMLISSFVVQMTSVDAYELGQTIIKESGVSADIYSSTEPDAVSRQENLQEFMSGMQDFVESRREEGREQEIFLTDFLQEVALLTDLDSDDNETSRVTLMTIHSAKGLEFPTVFIVGLEENLFPSPLSVNSLRELEEERRLLYVAITRAEKHCILTNAKSRFRYGKMEFGTPSRFLKDIDPSLMLIEDNGAGISSQKSFTGNSSSQKSFTGYRSWGDDWRSSGSSRMQNSRPVASQFRADPKPKITAPSRPEPAVDPFSERFKQRLAQSGGNLRRINDVMTKGRTQPNTQHPTPITQQEGTKASPSGARSEGALSVGSIIEHQRFGIGTVLRIEGTGENTKATVEFRNAGIKQLLLKFAKYKIIS